VKPQDYEIVIRPLTKAEGGGFGTTVPGLPGCMSDGDTPQEALDNVCDAIACWIEASREMGRPVPSRSGRRPEGRVHEIKEVLSFMGLRLGMVRQAAKSPGHGCKLRGSSHLPHPGWRPEKEMTKKLEQELLG
jgi:predicted RNase H-like HicB family nuclease